MTSREPRPHEHSGLCGSCVHATVVVSSRGTRFYLCNLSRTDPAFARYPQLPVLACRGYAAASAAPPEDISGR